MHFSLLQRQPTSLTITVTKFFPSPSYLTRVVQGQNECYFLSSRLLRRWLSFCYYLLYLCAECHYKKWKRCGIEFHESNVGPNEGEASKATRPFSCQAELSFFSLLLLQSNSLLPPFNNGFGTPFIWPTRLQVFKKVENSSNGNPRWLPFFLHKLQRVIRRAFAFCSWCAVQKEKKEKAREIWEICQKRRSRAIQFCTAFHSSKTNSKDKAPHNFSMHLYGALGFVRRRRRSLDSQSFSCKKCLVNHVLSLAACRLPTPPKKVPFQSSLKLNEKV